MLLRNKGKLWAQFMMVSCFSLVLIHPSGTPSVSYAQEGEEQIEGQTEEEVTSRGIRKRLPRSSMRRVQPTQKASTSGLSQQMAALQRQIAALQAQVNTLRTVIQVANGVATFQSKVIRLQGESVTVKSLKDGVTIESKKNLRIESKKGAVMKAGSNLDIHANAQLKLKGNAMANLQGAVVKLNNGSKPIANINSQVVVPPMGGMGKIVKGSPTVLVP